MQPLTHYELSYGIKNEQGQVHYSFGTKISDPQAESVVIGDLDPQATYVFRLLPVNDCMPGIWSNAYPVTLKPIPSAKPTPAAKATPTPTPTPTPVPTPTPKPTLIPTPVATPAPAVSSAHLPQEESGLSLLAIIAGILLGLLALLALLLPYRLGYAYDQANNRPLANIALELETAGRFIASRVTNSWGIYRGMAPKPSKRKHLQEAYLLKLANRLSSVDYQFVYTSEHDQLSLSTSYYPRLFRHPSLIRPTVVAPIFPLQAIAVSNPGKTLWRHQLLKALIHLLRSSKDRKSVV